LADVRTGCAAAASRALLAAAVGLRQDALLDAAAAAAFAFAFRSTFAPAFRSALASAFWSAFRSLPMPLAALVFAAFASAFRSALLLVVAVLRKNAIRSARKATSSVL
jgi:hypothetical protein